MDHLFLPKNPTIGTFDIPFVCTEEYDGGEFLSFPSRVGWVVKWTKWPPDYECWFSYHNQKVTGDLELGAFLQSWLFFGVLSHVLDRKVETASFQKRASDGSLVLSTTCLEGLLSTWSDEISSEEWAQDENQVREWCEKLFSSCLSHPPVICYRILFARQDDNDNDNITARVCMGSAALCGLVCQFLEDMFTNNGWDIPNTLKSHSWPVREKGLGQPLITRLRSNGWCSNVLASLVRSFAFEAFWFMANLETVEDRHQHEKCTSEFCIALQIDESMYKTAHIQPSCQCDFYGPLPEELAHIVSSGGLPLVSVYVEDDGKRVRVELQRKQVDTDFVAISHVWADGFGNPNKNALPTCVLLQLQSWVNTLSGTKGKACFWMDTLCLPLTPTSVRRLAITKLNEVFRLADKVLVLDSHLRNQIADGISLAEIYARVQISNWTRRYWTYVEGTIGQNIWFQFRDGPLSLDLKMQKFLSDDTALLPPPEGIAFWSIYYNHGNARLREEFKTDPFMRVTTLNDAFKARQTSHASDEPLCIGAILNLDMNTIVSADKDERMNTVWDCLHSVPVAIVFAPGTQRLSKPGYRWASKSLASITLPPGMFDECGEVCTKGLKANLYTALFSPDKSPSVETEITKQYFFSTCLTNDDDQFERKLWLQDCEGLWYKCDIDEDDDRPGWWHHDRAPIDVDTEEPAILLSRRLVPGGSTQQMGASGVLVTYPRVDRDKAVISVRAYKHVQVKVANEVEQEYYTELWQCSLEALAYFDDLRISLRDNVDLWTARIALWIDRHYDWRLTILRLAKEYETEADAKELHFVCAVKVAQLCRYGAWCLIDLPEERMTWYVD